MIKNNLLRILKSTRFKFIVCVLAAFTALFSISFNIGEKLYVRSHSETDKTVFGITQEQPLNINSELIIYDNMKNIASDIMNGIANNGTNIKISKEKLDSIRVIVNKMGYNDREYIFNILDRWESGNFNMITDEHNYFYLKLKQ
ncbi:DUF6241 domain-containing protein [Candidatus Clostridium radicumherbarum]|uniref:DUF6241 domain-containing protein n=1 Tax=Candidatus Clostridium radicumherbarum TaxID=3381662 RepID=A0ABW8TW79_9CLOT